MPPPAAKPRMTVRQWAMIVALSGLWGGSFFFVAVAVRELPPLTIVVLRVGLAAAILNAALLAAGIGLPWTQPAWRAFIGMGVLNNVIPFCLIVWGQTHFASGLAAVLNATTPLMTVVVAHVLTRDERLTAGRLTGIGLGLGGVGVMMGPEVLAGLGDGLLAQGAILAGALSYAFAGLYGRRFKAMGLSPLVTAAGQVTASGSMLLPIALIVDRPWTLAVPSPAVWGAVLGLAALSTALAYILYFRILAEVGAVNLVLVTFLTPVSAIVLGSVILGERLEPRQVLGMAAIAAGLAAIDGRLPRLVLKPERVRPNSPDRKL